MQTDPPSGKVMHLEQAWVYRTGEDYSGTRHERRAAFEATPMTYRLSDRGKQYVVICAGGHGKMGTKVGDYVIAYALPDR